MPYTKKQERLFGADLGRRRRGLKPRTTMTESQLEEAVKAPTKPPKRGPYKRRKR